MAMVRPGLDFYTSCMTLTCTKAAKPVVAVATSVAASAEAPDAVGYAAAQQQATRLGRSVTIHGVNCCNLAAYHSRTAALNSSAQPVTLLPVM